MDLNQTEVSQLYVSIFGRASEGEGNTYWQTNQSDMAMAADTMLDTEAAANYFGNTMGDDKAFIEHIYENTFDKTYAQDMAGIDFWTNELATNSRGEVVTSMITAAMDPANAGNAQDLFNNKVQVSNYTANTLNEPLGNVDFEGLLANVTSDFASVASAMGMVDDYAMEFMGGPGTEQMALNQTQVSQLYVSVFGRASEGEGNTYWQTSQADMAMTADTMLNTDAAASYFGNTMGDDKAFVEHIYENTFDKTYAQDMAGIDFWTNELATNSKGEVVTSMITAAMDPANAGDAQDLFKNKVEVSDYTANTLNEPSANVDFEDLLANVTSDFASVASAMGMVDDYAMSGGGQGMDAIELMGVTGAEEMVTWGE